MLAADRPISRPHSIGYATLTSFADRMPIKSSGRQKRIAKCTQSAARAWIVSKRTNEANRREQRTPISFLHRAAEKHCSIL